MQLVEGEFSERILHSVSSHVFESPINLLILYNKVIVAQIFKLVRPVDVIIQN